MMLKLKLQYFGHLMQRADSLEKTLMLGGIGSRRNEMAGWHHWFDGRESEWTPGVGDGQGGLTYCDSWGRKESDMTERLNWTELITVYKERMWQAWKEVYPVHTFLRRPCFCGGGCTSNAICILIWLPMCFPTGEHMPISLTPGSFLSQNCMYFCYCSFFVYFLKKFFLIYFLTLQHVQSQFPDQGLKPCPLQVEAWSL